MKRKNKHTRPRHPGDWTMKMRPKIEGALSRVEEAIQEAIIEDKIFLDRLVLICGTEIPLETLIEFNIGLEKALATKSFEGTKKNIKIPPQLLRAEGGSVFRDLGNEMYKEKLKDNRRMKCSIKRKRKR